MLEKRESGQIVKLPESGFQLKNDLGESPLLFAHFTQDQAAILVLSLLTGFGAAAWLGMLAGGLAIAIGINDFIHIDRAKKFQPKDERSEQDAWDKVNAIAAGSYETDDEAVEDLTELLDEYEQPQAYKALPGVNTRLNAIDVTPEQTYQGADPRVVTRPVIRPIDIAAALGRGDQHGLFSTVICGASRSGKGIVTAHALQHAKANHPGLKIWLIDPKGDPSESGYWSAVDRFVSADLSIPDERTVVDFAHRIDQLLDEYRDDPAKPKLLVIDEWLNLNSVFESFSHIKIVKQVLNRIKSTSVAVTSSGSSRGLFVWVQTQSPNAGDFGISGAALKSFPSLLVIHKDRPGLVHAAQSNGFIGQEPFDDEIFDHSGRAYYFRPMGGWQAMPIYDVPSAIEQTVTYPSNPPIVADDDEFDPIPEEEPVQQAIATPPRPTTESVKSERSTILKKAAERSIQQPIPSKQLSEEEQKAERFQMLLDRLHKMISDRINYQKDQKKWKVTATQLRESDVGQRLDASIDECKAVLTFLFRSKAAYDHKLRYPGTISESFQLVIKPEFVYFDEAEKMNKVGKYPIDTPPS